MEKNKFDGNLPSVLPKGHLKERIKTIRTTGLPQGYFTGVSNLDNVFRFDKGRLITITGVPNCGKSEFVDFYATTLNKRYGLKTLYFSPENQPCEFHLSKLISKYTNKPLSDLTPMEIDIAMEYICNNFYFCNYDKVKTLDDIEKQVKSFISSTPFDILVLDAYNKIESDKPAGEIETEFISKILDRLCDVAIKYNLMVILVAHPRKMDWKNYERVAQCPTAYDINGSANFYNKSDYVLAVHRDRDEDNETVTIRVDKVKFNHYGQQGKCYLKYDKDSGNYYNAPTTSWDYDDDSCSYTPCPFVFPELPAKKEPLDVIVSMYNGATDNVGTEICLKDFLLTDAYKDISEKIRRGSTPSERKDIKDTMKGMIPCVTIGGRFSQRDGEHLIEPSGLISIDIDLKDNGSEVMKKVPSILQKLKYVSYFSKSISGDGYFAVIKLENPLHFKQHFLALEQEMKTYGITLDKTCKDITRLRFASFDPDCYYNPDATTYYWEVEPNQPPKVKSQQYISSSTMSDQERLANELNFMKNQNIVIQDDYDTWFKMGMALNSAFGEDGRGLFHEFSKLSDKYDKDECDTQYNNIVSHYDSDSEITLGTLFHIIKEAKEHKMIS